MRGCFCIAGALSALLWTGGLHAQAVYEINQACLDVGCFAGDDPNTDTVEISHSAGTFRLTSDLVIPGAEQRSAITVDNVNNSSLITIDLNGYSIRHSGIAQAGSNGIVINGNNSIVTVRNGSMVALYDAISVDLSSTATVVVHDMLFRIMRNDAIQAPMGVIRNNVFDANEYGVYALNVAGTNSHDRVLLSDNLFIDDTGEQDAVFGMTDSNLCSNNVVGYDGTDNDLGGCTLTGLNLCGNTTCASNRTTDGGIKP